MTPIELFLDSTQGLQVMNLSLGMTQKLFHHISVSTKLEIQLVGLNRACMLTKIY